MSECVQNANYGVLDIPWRVSRNPQWFCFYATQSCRRCCMLLEKVGRHETQLGHAEICVGLKDQIFTKNILVSFIAIVEAGPHFQRRATRIARCTT